MPIKSYDVYEYTTRTVHTPPMRSTVWVCVNVNRGVPPPIGVVVTPWLAVTSGLSAVMY